MCHPHGPRDAILDPVLLVMDEAGEAEMSEKRNRDMERRT